MKQHLIFIFILFFIVACKRDNSSGELPDIYNYLTKDQIAKTPYFTNPDFDTLTFISNKGDTLIFAKQKTISSFYRTEITGCNGCASQYSNYQQLLNTYQTIKGNGKFEVKHSKKGIAYDRINDDFLTISFNEFTFFATDNRLGTKTGTIYHDSLTFGNKKYYNVTKYFHHFNEQTQAECYLNIEFGFIYIFDFKNNLHFQIIKP